MVEWIEIWIHTVYHKEKRVSTLVVEWIEIYIANRERLLYTVSTLVVEWIEIMSPLVSSDVSASPPSWWSGLKSVRT